MAQLDNEWGTTQDEFKSGIYDPLVPNCDKVFENTPSLQTIINYRQYTDEAPKKQSWDLKIFTPTFYPDLSKLYESVNEISDLNQTTEDEVNTTLAGLDGKYRKDCKKLHICIIPNTKTHPNIRVTFDKNGYYDSVNKVVADSINKKLDKAQEEVKKSSQLPKDICDISPTSEACASITNCQIGRAHV